MPLGTLAPIGWYQIIDPLTGLPAGGAKIETRLSGTATNEPVYQDAALTVPHPQPVVCDAYGVVVIYLAAKSYKFTVKRSDGSLIREIDPVSAVQLTSSLLTDMIPLGGAPSLGTTDAAYPAGATLDKVLFGSRIVPIDSANIVGTWALRAMLRSDNGASIVTLALVNLSDGAPDTAIVEITSTSAVGELITSAAVTFAAAGASKNYGIKLKVAGGFGQAWNAELVRTA